MTREQIQHESDRPLPCAAQEAFRCRPDALSDDEKTILSAMVLQKGEAEAGAIFANSPGRLGRFSESRRSICVITRSSRASTATPRWADTTSPMRLPSRRSYTSTWIWARWAAAMRTSTPACSSAVIMCATLRRNRILPWKCSS